MWSLLYNTCFCFLVFFCLLLFTCFENKSCWKQGQGEAQKGKSCITDLGCTNLKDTRDYWVACTCVYGLDICVQSLMCPKDLPNLFNILVMLFFHGFNPHDC